jgi:hypothetical protein
VDKTDLQARIAQVKERLALCIEVHFQQLDGGLIPYGPDIQEATELLNEMEIAIVKTDMALKRSLEQMERSNKRKRPDYALLARFGEASVEEALSLLSPVLKKEG